MFKKVLVMLCLLGTIGLFAARLTDKDIIIGYDNFGVVYIENKKVCEAIDPSMTLYFLKEYKNGNLIVDSEVVKWDNGATYIVAMRESTNDGKVYSYHFFNSMDMCYELKKIMSEPKK